MNAARSTRAPRMPQKSTRCCSADGTLKYAKITMNTNRLSTERAFSMM